MSFHRFTAYIQYRLRANTRHGIHSPFVYAFIDNCLGVKSNLSLEERINAYFGDAIKWAGDGFDIEPGDAVFVMGIRGIHKTKQQTQIWNDLAANAPGFVISIDLYSIGLLIYNPDVKEKQHFVLKYPL